MWERLLDDSANETEGDVELLVHGAQADEAWRSAVIGEAVISIKAASRG